MQIGFFNRLKYKILFTMSDIRYWFMNKFDIKESRRILRLRLNGFNPIMFTSLMFEDTWVFETDEEAKRAFYTFEQDKNTGEYLDKFDGWWYGIEEFNRQAEENKDWNYGITDRFWIKKGYHLDFSNGYIKIVKNKI